MDKGKNQTMGLHNRNRMRRVLFCGGMALALALSGVLLVLQSPQFAWGGTEGQDESFSEPAVEVPVYDNSVSGTLWLDENENGVYEEGEKLISAYPVYLYAADDLVEHVQGVVTDESGRYLFENMEPGSYVVKVAAGYSGTTPYEPAAESIPEDSSFAPAEDGDALYSDVIQVEEASNTAGLDAGLQGSTGIAPAAITNGYVVSGDMATTSFNTLKDACDAINADGGTNYTITVGGNDPAMGDVATIDSGKSVTLQSASGGPYTILQTAALSPTNVNNANYEAKARHFAVYGTLILEDVILEGLGLTTAAGNTYNGGLYVDGGSFIMNHSDAAIQSCYHHLGGAVFLSDLAGGGSSFTLEDGEIRNNASDNYGGGVSAYEGSTITINGGKIINNTADVTSTAGQGGGVHATRSAVTIDGGEISGNKAYTGAGIRMAASNGSLLWIVDGKIANNEATSVGGGLYIANNFLMEGGEISGNTANASYGGGMFATGGFSNPFSIKMAGGEIKGNSAATTGGGVQLYENATFELEDGEISGNQAGTNGGGIWGRADCSLEMKGGRIAGNQAGSNGGGVYLLGHMEMTGGTIGGAGTGETNTAANGGGIYLDSGATASLTAGAGQTASVTGNTAKEGGGVYFDSNTTLTLDGADITGNTAYSETAATAYGGGIYLANGDLALKSGSIADNAADGLTAPGQGGGVYVASTSSGIAMSGGRIAGNTAKTNGGGVYYTANTMQVTGGSISGNTAGEYGGGVYFESGRLEVEDAAIGGSGTDDPNTASRGGGVYFTTGTLTMKDSTLEGNQASTDGGGVHMNQAGSIQIEGSTITGNTADSGGNTANGGGISAASGGLLELTDCTFSDNQTSGSGGGIYASNVKVTLDQVQFLSNAANLGGGMYGANIDCTVTDSLIHNNTATNGGGVYLNSSSSTLTMTGTKITENQAATSGGGVYQNSYAKFIMQDGEISGNTAATSGGGVDVRTYSSFTMEGGSLTGNRVTGSSTQYGGGGICLADGTVTIESGAAVYNNEAVYGGGVRIRSADGLLKVDGGVIGGTTASEANTASISGGGVYMSSGTMTMENGAAIDNNTATNGGGVYLDGSSAWAEIQGGSVSANAASANGGGVYMSGGTMTVENGAAIDQNTAHSGGGVYMDGSSALAEIQGGSISSNWASGTAGGGGGVYINSGTMTMENAAAIHSNRAYQGGGVYLDSSTASARILGGSIRDNQAENSGATNSGTGGGVYVNNGELTLDGGTIGGTGTGEANTAASGGGVCVIEGKMEMHSGEISGHNVSSNGGGVYVRSEDATVLVDGGKISDNSAVSGGGVYLVGGSTISAMLTVEGSGAICDNTASQSGGGVYANTGSGVTLQGSAQVYGNRVTGTSGSDSGGGGIYATGTPVAVTLDGNAAVHSNTASSGGGVYAKTSASVEILGSAEMYQNSASESGGGLYLVSDASLRMSGTPWIYANTAVQSGGGIHAEGDGDFVLTGGTIGGSKADEGNQAGGMGGGIALMRRSKNRSSTNTLTDVQITYNATTSANPGASAIYGGGGMYIASDYDWIPVEMNRVTVADNTTVEYGGGISAQYGAYITITDSTIRDNEAQYDGGGLYLHLDEAPLLSSRSLPAGSFAPAYDYVYECSLVELENSIVEDNTAGRNGGGAYLGGVIDEWMNETYHYPAQLTMKQDSRITSNAAGNNGAGVYLDNGVLELEANSAEIDGNIADQNGGGLYVADQAIFSMAYGKISGNRAVNGGGVYVEEDAGFEMTGGEIGGTGAGDANTASNHGGGIYNRSAGSVGIQDASITGNNAVNGGGIYNASTGPIDIQDSKITGNTALGDGGGIYQTDMTLRYTIVTGSNVTFSGNTAQKGYAWDGTLSPYFDSAHLAAALPILANGYVASGDGTYSNAAFTNAYNNYDVNFTPEIDYAKQVDRGDGTDVQVGDTITYTILCSYMDPALNGVTVTDALDSGLDYVEAYDVNGMALGTAGYSGGTVTWTVGSEALGTAAWVKIEVQVNSTASVDVRNQAVINDGSSNTTNETVNPVAAGDVTITVEYYYFDASGTELNWGTGYNDIIQAGNSFTIDTNSILRYPNHVEWYYVLDSDPTQKHYFADVGATITSVPADLLIKVYTVSTMVDISLPEEDFFWYANQDTELDAMLDVWLKADGSTATVGKAYAIQSDEYAITNIGMTDLFVELTGYENLTGSSLTQIEDLMTAGDPNDELVLNLTGDLEENALGQDLFDFSGNGTSFGSYSSKLESGATWKYGFGGQYDPVSDTLPPQSATSDYQLVLTFELDLSGI